MIDAQQAGVPARERFGQIVGNPVGTGLDRHGYLHARQRQLRVFGHRRLRRTVRERAGLEDVRVHDLRHSFASRALALGESLAMIGRLLGHSKIQTTARYAHLARDSVRLSAAKVAASIGADILPEGSTDQLS